MEGNAGTGALGSGENVGTGALGSDDRLLAGTLAASASTITVKSEDRKKRKFKECPATYTCKLCDQAGHWVYDCAQFVPNENKKKKKKKKNPGLEKIAANNQRNPTEADIAKAKEMQKKMAFVNKNRPKCFCGLASKLSKVKRTKNEDPNSPAIGCFFYFCSKDQRDETKCSFNRPVEEDENTKKYTSSGSKDKKKKCRFYFANGECKKGESCNYSHAR